MSNRRAPFVFASAVILCAVSGLLLTHFAQKSRAQTPPPAAAPQQDRFGNLAKAVAQSPGCLGIETVGTPGGKKAIFSWFENKKAVVTFYNSMMRQNLMKMMPTPRSGRAPLEGVKDANAPILVITSVTPAEKPDPVTKMPLSQIAIELYTPLPGGFAYGGRFAPSTVKVAGLSEAAAAKR